MVCVRPNLVQWQEVQIPKLQQCFLGFFLWWRPNWDGSMSIRVRQSNNLPECDQSRLLLGKLISNGNTCETKDPRILHYADCWGKSTFPPFLQVLLALGQSGANGLGATPLGSMARSSGLATAPILSRLLPVMATQLRWLHVHQSPPINQLARMRPIQVTCWKF